MKTTLNIFKNAKQYTRNQKSVVAYSSI